MVFVLAWAYVCTLIALPTSIQRSGEEQHILDWSGHSHHLSMVKFVSKTKLVGHCMY